MKAEEESCFEPGDLVEYERLVDHTHRWSIDHVAAIVLEHSVPDGDITFGERMMTKLLTPYDGIQMMYNSGIHLIHREERDVGK